MYPQSHGAVPSKLRYCYYCMNVKYDLVLRKFNLILLTYVDHCGVFHAAVVYLQKRTESHVGFRK